MGITVAGGVSFSGGIIVADSAPAPGGSIYLPNYAAPLASDFPTLVQTSGAGLTLTNTSNGLEVSCPANSGGPNTGLALRSASSSAAFSVTAGMNFAALDYYVSLGLCLYDSGSGKMVSITYATNDNGPDVAYAWVSGKWNSISSYAGTYAYRLYQPPGLFYTQISYDGVQDITFSIGPSPDSLVSVNVEALSTFLGSFDKVGLIMSVTSTGGSKGPGVGLVTWYEDTGLAPRQVQVSTP